MANRTTYEILAKTKGFKDSEKQVNGLNGALGGLAQKALAVGGAYFGARALLDGVNASIEAFGKQELAEKKLEQALGKTSTALLNQASALQKVTTFGDEAIIAQQAFLASVGMTEEQIKDILPVAADLAAATGMTLESAVRNTAKTFSGLAGELGELVPQLRDLTAEQMKAGDAVKVMADLFGGAATAETQTFTGQIMQLQNVFGDFAEDIGRHLVESGAMKSVITWAKDASEAYLFFTGQLTANKEVVKPYAEEIATLETQMGAINERMIANAELSSNDNEIKERAIALGKTEAEVRQLLIDANTRDAVLFMRKKEEQESFLGLQQRTIDGTAVEILEIEKLEVKVNNHTEGIKKLNQATEDYGTISRVQLNAIKMLKKADLGSIYAGAAKDIASAVGANDEFMQGVTIAQAIADTYAGANRALAQGGMFGTASAIAIVAAGLANVRQINQAYKNKQKQPAQYGFEGVVDEPTQFTVGEGGAAEYVSVQPMEGVNNAGGQGININISGNVMSDDFVSEELAEKISEAVRKGVSFGMN